MATKVLDYKEFFQRACELPEPYHWQSRVARDGLPELLSIPTGFGKTEGATLAWAYRRFITKVPGTPRHLVICLPMRVLVRQTVERLATIFRRLHQAKLTADRVGVFASMGEDEDSRKGVDDWLANPEKEWVLVGTQDRLLSAALNRGYGVSRFYWPVHFGILNNDCHWIFDEIQLMGPAVWTSAQLDWMRRDRFKTIFPCTTTWMSATVGADFFDTRDRRDAGWKRPEAPDLISEDRNNPAARERFAARRPIAFLEGAKAKKAATIAREILDHHAPGTLSLVVCNTVAAAQEIFSGLGSVDHAVLLSSRFCAGDRAASESRLNQFEQRRKQAKGPVAGDPGLICVSTQVVEAGVDISAQRLWSEVAPWASVVQRLGRLNRDGRDNQHARAVFWEPVAADEGLGKTWVGPYLKDALKLSRQLLNALEPLSNDLSAFDALAELRKGKLGKVADGALEAKPAPLPRAIDVHGLFSTEPDLYGGFTDVSVFVRDADPNSDLTVFWRDFKVQSMPAPEDLTGPRFKSEEGCPVSVYAIRKLLDGKRLAHTWDAEAGRWQAQVPDALRPGMIVMLPASAGGYQSRLGWTGKPGDLLNGRDPPGLGGRRFDDDVRSQLSEWVSLQSHLADAQTEAEALVGKLEISQPLQRAVVAAAAEHDVGKAHPQWSRSMGKPKDDATIWAKFPAQIQIDVDRPEREQPLLAFLRSTFKRQIDLLSSPEQPKSGARFRVAIDGKLSPAERESLRAQEGVKKVTSVQLRPGMRHEAATALSMWHRYWRKEASHSLLSIYLAAAHHGKVRTHLKSLRKGGSDVWGVPRGTDSLPWSGGRPLDFGGATDGAAGEFVDEGFIMTAPGWTAVISDLLGPARPGRPWETGSVPPDEPRALGPFQLAYLEALVRIADWRASAQPSEPQHVG